VVSLPIGSGGPFGAEGPIIMTGGALGLVLAQHLELTADERKALLVAGAAAGMAATSNAPLASVLLAVELLLFEWRPRSMLPVATAVAVAVATVTRMHILGVGHVFAVPAVALHLSITTYVLCAAVGVATGALGVGYDVIRELLAGRAAMSLIVGIFIVKSLIWSLSVGSGTLGGVLAPKLTGRWDALLPLLIGATGAYLLTALTLKRSVLTEKVARRGFHLTREYDVDPLAVLFVREVMDTGEVVVYDTRDRLSDVVVRDGTELTSVAQRQRICPVTGPDRGLAGVVTRRDLQRATRVHPEGSWGSSPCPRCSPGDCVTSRRSGTASESCRSRARGMAWARHFGRAPARAESPAPRTTPTG